MNPGGRWLLAGAALSATASVIHLACIVLGAKWFRFFGAPEPLVAAYEIGDMQLVWMTIGIAIILAIWAAFAASGAGLLPRLPLLRTGLVAISAIYLARGAILFPAFARAPYPGSTFDIWSSAIVLGFGLVYAYGTWAAWSSLRETRQAH